MVILIVSFVLFLYRTPYIQFVTSDMKTYGRLESYFRPSFVINSNILWIWGLLLFQVRYVLRCLLGLGVHVDDQCKSAGAPKKAEYHRGD